MRHYKTVVFSDVPSFNVSQHDMMADCGKGDRFDDACVVEKQSLVVVVAWNHGKYDIFIVNDNMSLLCAVSFPFIPTH